MNKTQSIQRSKLITSYGGVGSIIDTIDNLAYMIKPFDKWNIYRQITRTPSNFPHLLFGDQRLVARLHNIGFSSLTKFFLPDDNFENVKLFNPDNNQVNRMVTADYSPQWFYCEKCGRLRTIGSWNVSWGANFNEPRCSYCRTGNQRYRAPKLQQVRFVLASLENGELKDIPWDMLWSVKSGGRNFQGNNGAVRSVWDFRNNRVPQNVDFHIRKGGSDLIDIYVKFNNGSTLTMAEIMNHYFILEDGHVYQPVIRSANNVYFSYSMSSLYIPRHIITQQEVDKVINAAPRFNASDIHQYIIPKLSIQDIQYIIDNGVAPNPDYRSDESFRMDEFDYITNHGNYVNGQYKPDERLESWEYIWNDYEKKPQFVTDIFLLKHLEVTTVQVAYSRLERVSAPDYVKMSGQSHKQWFDLTSGVMLNPNSSIIEIGLHPTCDCNRRQIQYMPAIISRGEGFFVELDLSRIKDNNSKEIFTHTFAHLVMKELEFSCGYPLSSMNERLYILPTKLTNSDYDKYGFVIYSANGEAGSYGGISTLFDTGAIEKILNNAVELAEDCPNNPICDSQGASCFACVQIPETACELFNSKLNRNIILQYKNTNPINVSTSPSADKNSTTKNNHKNEDDKSKDNVILG